MSGFRRVTGFAGDLTAEEYPAEGLTHVCVPVRVREPTAEQAVETATRAASVMFAAALNVQGVESVTSPAEGAYALIANLATALEHLDPTVRAALHEFTAGNGTREQLLEGLNARERG